MRLDKEPWFICPLVSAFDKTGGHIANMFLKTRRATISFFVTTPGCGVSPLANPGTVDSLIVRSRSAMPSSPNGDAAIQGRDPELVAQFYEDRPENRGGKIQVLSLLAWFPGCFMADLWNEFSIWGGRSGGLGATLMDKRAPYLQ